jgi:aminoglycoside phosphotransferase (APT) family kinase protein
MKSLTKSKIPQHMIGELVRACFGEAAELLGVREQGGGMFNTACMVTVKNILDGPERELVLKVSVLPDAELLSYERNVLHTEIDINRKLGESGVPVPKIVAADFSQKLLNSDYFFMEKLPGVTWFEMNTLLSFEDKTRLKEQLGSYTAMIHSVKNDRFGYPSLGIMYDNWRDAFLAMLENVVRDGQKLRLRLPYKEIISAVTSRASLLEEITQPRLVDFDLWAGNVLLTDQNGAYEIEGFIDFERAFYGDPYADLVSAMMIYDDVRREGSFLKGYERVSGRELGFNDNDLMRMLMYRLYLSMITAIETYRYPRGFAQYARGACRKQIAYDLAELKACRR